MAEALQVTLGKRVTDISRFMLVLINVIETGSLWWLTGCPVPRAVAACLGNVRFIKNTSVPEDAPYLPGRQL